MDRRDTECVSQENKVVWRSTLNHLLARRLAPSLGEVFGWGRYVGVF